MYVSQAPTNDHELNQPRVVDVGRRQPAHLGTKHEVLHAQVLLSLHMLHACMHKLTKYCHCAFSVARVEHLHGNGVHNRREVRCMGERLSIIQLISC